MIPATMVGPNKYSTVADRRKRKINQFGLFGIGLRIVSLPNEQIGAPGNERLIARRVGELHALSYIIKGNQNERDMDY